MKTVVAYLAGVPSPLKNPHKVEVLKNFINGVNGSGDRGIAHQGTNLINSDIGIIQGWVHDGSPNSSHLNLRRNVSKNTHNKHTIIIDSNLFNYNVGKLHPKHYSRYSMDGVFPTTGNYFNKVIDPSRWKQISQDLNLHLKEWRNVGNHILLACQRNGGWSMGGYDVVKWVEDTVKEIRKYSDRPIIVRGHPGDKNSSTYLSERNVNWTLSRNEKISDDFKNAWATVTYNSSPGVASAIEGIPVFVTDPNPKISQAFDVANISLSQIENPQIFERQQWVEQLSMSHWKLEELANGSAWRHIRNYV